MHSCFLGVNGTQCKKSKWWLIQSDEFTASEHNSQTWKHNDWLQVVSAGKVDWVTTGSTPHLEEMIQWLIGLFVPRPQFPTSYVGIGNLSYNGTIHKSLQDENVTIITVRNRVVARLCFYTCPSFCSQGGLPKPPGQTHPPQFPREQTPPGQTSQADTPGRHPLDRHPPCAVHARRYGQQAGGTHPTGMQSCITISCLMGWAVDQWCHESVYYITSTSRCDI